MKDINQVLMNPARSRIIQIISANEECTATFIGEQLKDIPRTTLYRHIQILVENKILAVVKSEQVRGTIEKTYAIDQDTMKKADSVDSAIKSTFSFLMNIYSDFEKYLRMPSSDINRDMLFFRSTNLYMSDEECAEFVSEISKSIQKRAHNKPTLDRKPRQISLISSPVEEK